MVAPVDGLRELIAVALEADGAAIWDAARWERELGCERVADLRNALVRAGLPLDLPETDV